MSLGQNVWMSTWCPLPWMFQYVRTNGDYRVCCHQVQAKGVVRSADGATMNIETHDLHDFRNSAELRKMRAQFLAGEWPETCENCRTEEAAGLTSRRQTDMRRWAAVFSESHARAMTAADGSFIGSGQPVLGLDMRLGTKCNLKCRMCHPRSSSAWLGDHVALWGSQYYEYGKLVEIVPGADGQLTTQNVSYAWPSKQLSWDRLEAILDEIHYIYIAGGEPLLIEEHFQLLDHLIARGRASEVRIEMASNLTVLPQPLVEKWLEFGGIGLSASIDGVGRVNDYIRYPSRWDVVERNFLKLNSIGSPIDLWIQPTVQALNVYYLPQLYEWRMGFELKSPVRAGDKDIMVPHILRDPKYYTVQVFPEPIKQKLEHHLTHSARKLEALSRGQAKGERVVSAYTTFIKAVVEFMWAEDHSEQFGQFLRVTRDLDRLRGQNFSRALPELAEILEVRPGEVVASEY